MVFVEIDLEKLLDGARLQEYHLEKEEARLREEEEKAAQDSKYRKQAEDRKLQQDDASYCGERL